MNDDLIAARQAIRSWRVLCLSGIPRGVACCAGLLKDVREIPGVGWMAKTARHRSKWAVGGRPLGLRVTTVPPGAMIGRKAGGHAEER